MNPVARYVKAISQNGKFSVLERHSRGTETFRACISYSFRKVALPKGLYWTRYRSHRLCRLSNYFQPRRLRLKCVSLMLSCESHYKTLVLA
jgi:hypothetical protein